MHEKLIQELVQETIKFPLNLPPWKILGNPVPFIIWTVTTANTSHHSRLLSKSKKKKKTKVGRASFTPFKSLDLYLLHVPTLPAAGPDTAAAGITFSVRSALLLFLDPAGTEQEDKPRLDRQHLKATPDCNRDPTKTCLGKVEWTFLCTFPRQAVI